MTHKPRIDILNAETFTITVNGPRHSFDWITLTRSQAQAVWEAFAPYFDGREFAPVAIVGDLEE